SGGAADADGSGTEAGRVHGLGRGAAVCADRLARGAGVAAVSALLELDGVGARMGAATVLDGVSLSVGAGELVALCGPNGAGKSSAIRASLGLTGLQNGAARLGGED